MCATSRFFCRAAAGSPRGVAGGACALRAPAVRAQCCEGGCGGSGERRSPWSWSERARASASFPRAPIATIPRLLTSGNRDIFLTKKKRTHQNTPGQGTVFLE